MPVAIASARVGTTLVVWFDGKSKIELSPVTVFGVTIVFPSWLIQCACGCPRPMSILRSTDVAPGESSTTDCGPSSPFTATWTSSVSVGNLWLGTDAHGALKITKHGWTTYGEAEGLGTSVSSIFETPAGD